MGGWIPDMASLKIETLMEENDFPEADRDEVRRFSEVLGRIGNTRNGIKNPPAPDGMKEWLLGKDGMV